MKLYDILPAKCSAANVTALGNLEVSLNDRKKYHYYNVLW